MERIRRMSVVNNCPTNLAEIAKASKRLGCKNDTYGNNQYLCVPDLDKTSMQEFCFDGIMGIHKKNHCVAAAEKSLVEISCLTFSSGCPHEHHWTFEFYKYPACQNINTQHHCYVMDPSCPLQVPDEDTGNHDTIDPIWIILTVILVLLIMGSVCCLIYWLIQKRLTGEPRNERQRDDKKSQDRISDIITSIESFLIYKKDKEHCEHDCESYLIREDKHAQLSQNVIKNDGDCIPPNNIE